MKRVMRCYGLDTLLLNDTTVDHAEDLDAMSSDTTADYAGLGSVPNR